MSKNDGYPAYPAQVQFGGADDPLGRQEEYGSDVTMSMINGSIGIVHKAKIAKICCDSCNGSKGRKYFWVLENAYETNFPITFPCPCFPPNCCCPGIDHVKKTYFDRGPWDRQHCCFTLGCYNGDSFFHEGNVRHVCCFQDCCDCYNSWSACYCPTYCGDRVNFVPAERVCCCCPVRANWCNNCFGIW